MNDLGSDTREHRTTDRTIPRPERARLQRPRDERLVLGVCGAIAKRFEVDVLIVRVLIVMAGALFDYVSLAYFLGVLVIPAAPRLVDQWGKVSRARRPRRQLLAYVLLAIVANAVLHNSIPTSRSFAVALIVGGVLMMQLRSRSTQEKRRMLATNAAADSGPEAGGWTASTSSLPPRWGLAGETVNPHIWDPTIASPTSTQREKRPTVWQTQFGNLALVVLVSVLAVGLWSNTSRLSPVRRAALKERLADGGVVVRTAKDIEEINQGSLGDGSFVIDASQFNATRLNALNVPLKVTMGSGKLELILPTNFVSSGEIATTDIGHLGAELNGKALASPFKVLNVPGDDGFSNRGQSSDRSGPDSARRFVFSIAAQNGFVCVRTAAADCAINSTNSPLQSTSPKK